MTEKLIKTVKISSKFDLASVKGRDDVSLSI